MDFRSWFWFLHQPTVDKTQTGQRQLILVKHQNTQEFAIPSKGSRGQEIGCGLYLVTDGVYNIMFLVDDDIPC